MLNKAQMKSLETIFVLFIFFFMLVFGFIFYAGFSQRQAGEDYEKKVALQALESAQRVQYLPELQCTKDGKYVEADCIDLYKLEAFQELKGVYKDTYSKYFPNTLITINLVYPWNKHKEWVVYNYTINTSKSGTRYHIPVSLYNVTSDNYYFGYVMVEARY
ncbi:MAG: hypothetical protein ACQESF_00185 [Nanobdellota archaeon]